MNRRIQQPMTLCVGLLCTLACASAARGQAVWGDPGTSTFTAKADASHFADNTPGAIPPCDVNGCLPTRRYFTAEWGPGAACNPAGPVLDPCTLLFGLPIPPAPIYPLFDSGCDCFANPTNAMTPGFAGHDAGGLVSASAGYPWGAQSTSTCMRTVPPCNPLIDNLSIQAEAWGRSVYDGIGSSLLTVHWKCDASTTMDVECTPANVLYCVYGQADMNNHVEVTVNGVPSGQPVLIHASWYLVLNTNYDPELPGPPDDDPAEITINQFDVAGTDLLPPGGLSFSTVSALVYYPPTGGSGVIPAHGGDTIIVNFAASAKAGVKNDPDPRVTTRVVDKSWAHAYGVLLLSIDRPIHLPPPYLQPPGAPAEFSLDIGSDTEMSDPYQDFDEVFDPGDMYPWNGPLLPSGGADGVRDDALIFGVDYWPQAPDGPPPATGALTCQSTGAPIDDVLNGSRFDLDGSDTIGEDLAPLIPTTSPLTNPILRAQHLIDCVYAPTHLIVSFDDDEAGHYIGTPTGCTVPVNSRSGLSPTQSHTYGQVPDRDEVVAIGGLNRAAPPSMQVIDVASIRDEETLHANLYPNPDTREKDDDDVDALDVANAPCAWWYISPDQEATGLDGGFNLDAGGIHRVNALGGLPVKVIDDFIHLGLGEATDIDALEFVWLPHPSGAGDALALLFSVVPDDPLTLGIDESGGLDPRQIYGSFLDGTYFNYLGFVNVAGTFTATPLDDNVDAIAASPVPYAASPCNIRSPFLADGCDAYAACGSLAGMGGWEIWPNPPGTAGQVFTANPNPLTAPCGPQSAFSGSQSARITAGDDVLQHLSINPVGTWTVTAYTYVPSTATGAGYFILMNNYDPAQSNMLPPDYWSIELKFDADNFVVVEDFSGDAAPLLLDQWVPVRAEIDFGTDQVDLYYAGFPMHSGPWTRGLPQASRDLAVIDLFGNTISEMFFDDVIVWSIADCNGNLVADACDIAGGTSTDCQGNGQPDECDLAGGFSADCNVNGVPDECELPFPDFDGDTDVDSGDYVAFSGCVTGPCANPPCIPPLYSGPCCSLADGDSDGDVDLEDFGWFQLLFTGP